MPTALLWLVFAVVVLVMLALDLGVFQRLAHHVSAREAVIRSVIWITLALLFGLLVLAVRGAGHALDYVTAYLIEESLSVDNIFVFLVIFSYFGVPPRYQHNVLFWGIITAIVLRGLFIGAGVAAIQRLHWLSYFFGLLLVYTGMQMARGRDHHADPGKNPVIRFCTRVLRVTDDFGEGRFFITRERKYFATSLFIVLIAIETTDVVFAVDSVPAVLAITLDPMVAYTSNIFAIAGLRSLYFALAGALPRFRYLHHGLAVILVLIGLKMLLAEWYRPPTVATLGAVVAVLCGAVVASLLRQKAARAEVARAVQYGGRGGGT